MDHLLVEPAIVPDVFCSGLAEIEDLGDGNWRFTLFARQMNYCGERRAENVIVARYIMTQAAVLTGMQMTMKSMGYACCGGERMKLRH